MSETDIVNETLIRLCKTFPNGLWYRRNVGAMRVDNRMIRFGMQGQADIGGILNGRAVEIELKTATGRQSDSQKNWQSAVEKSGGVYILARSPDGVIEKLCGFQF